MTDFSSPTEDQQLTANDIGQLESADQVVHFFARLGYDVDGSLPLTHAALGLDTADLQQQIRTLRRVAADPVDGDLVIYLAEHPAASAGHSRPSRTRAGQKPGETGFGRGGRVLPALRGTWWPPRPNPYDGRCRPS